MGAGIAVLAVTGFLLVASEPNRAMFRTVFWVKMVLVLVAALVTWSQKWAAPAAVGGSSFDGGLRRRVVAAVSIVLWVAVIFSGRWIGYATSWPGAPA
jgi:hypothetical protein